GFERHYGRASPAIVHATILCVSIAPEVRETSRPPRINRSVGMPDIPSRDETAGAVSELSFSKRAVGSSSFAPRSYIGAIARQGPHHGAQTSMGTGISLFATWRPKPSSSTSIGWSLKIG